MNSVRFHRLAYAGAAGLALVLLAGCGADSGSSSAAVSVPASISLSKSSGPVLAAAAFGMASDISGGRITPASIDSLIVTVTQVDVLPDSVLAACHPPVGDSLGGFHPGRPEERPDSDDIDRPRGPCNGDGHGMMGPRGMPPFPPGHDGDHGRPDDPRTHADSILPPDSGWGSRPNQWYSLTVTGNGRIDLLHLPSDSANGLMLAAGSVPAGDYGAARLIISDATIWLNTAVTTEDGVTLQPNTPYPVSLPRRHGARMGIMTNAGFTVPTGGGNVVLIFDVSQMLAGAIVTDSGKVVLAPLLRPHH